MSLLSFKHIPRDFEENETVLFFGIELSGIQKFIFNVTETKGSLKQIKENSLRIESLTQTLHDILEKSGLFKDLTLITNTSGKIYFIAKNSTDVQMSAQLLESLQKDVFLTFEGELRLYYGHIEANLSTKLGKEKSAYRELKDVLALSRRKNYELLNIENHEIDHHLNKTIDLKTNHTIDELIHPDQDHRYITGIKMDFDNLGAFFASIGYSDEIETTSKLMIEAIDSVIDNIEGIYKVFVGGDDIFILSNFPSFMDIAQKIKNGLQKAFEQFDYDFGVSAGIVHFKEKTSIVYYGEQLENELHNAKTKGKNRVSMENTCFEWHDFESMKSLTNTIIQKYGKATQKSSQLAQFENTMHTIIYGEETKEKGIRQFILKIPLFESRISGFVPKKLLAFKPGKTDTYYTLILQLFFATKYARRLMERV